MSNGAIAQQAQSYPSYTAGILLVLFAGLCWSTIGIGIRSIEHANTWQILLYRSAALSVFLFLVIAYRSQGRPLTAIYRVGMAGVIGGVGLVVAFAGGIYAVQMTSVANAAFLFASAPFLAAVLGWLVLRESVRGATWIAAVLGLVIWVSRSVGIIAGPVNFGNSASIVLCTGFMLLQNL